ncbi:hypothetical protein ABTW96_32840 [Nocardia beijingensis]|uniref:hypothetical protein n=1 Tax=Nocardia beijingensis TaxID=95162 RepID=UPI00332E6B1B
MYEIGVAAGLPSALSPGVLSSTFAQDLLLEGRELAEVVYLMGRSKPDLGRSGPARGGYLRPAAAQRARYARR